MSRSGRIVAAPLAGLGVISLSFVLSFVVAAVHFSWPTSAQADGPSDIPPDNLTFIEWLYQQMEAEGAPTPIPTPYPLPTPKPIATTIEEIAAEEILWYESTHLGGN